MAKEHILLEKALKAVLQDPVFKHTVSDRRMIFVCAVESGEKYEEIYLRPAGFFSEEYGPKGERKSEQRITQKQAAEKIRQSYTPKQFLSHLKHHITTQLNGLKFSELKDIKELYRRR